MQYESREARSDNIRSPQRPLLITFSGLDGSGKTTQIDGLCGLLQSRGYRIQRLAFWDDVVVATKYREQFVHKVFNSEAGVGAPGRPVNRRDKNMRGWTLGVVRHGLYLADSLSLCRVQARARHTSIDAIVMDRYIYDELVNLPLNNGFTRAFIAKVCALVPRPDLAYLLDADPELAQARKPEYPVDFMHQCRGWYHQLADMLGTMTVIPPAPLSEVQREVAEAFLKYLQTADDRAQLPRSVRESTSGEPINSGSSRKLA